MNFDYMTDLTLLLAEVDLWDILPYDLQLKVWALCPIKDICRAAAVSKAFSSAATDVMSKLKMLRIPSGASLALASNMITLSPA